ncbi:hypothetical protein TNCV_4752391 [Trichonephila clavipes]|nr:hypothetical protein TNCV_4752391 [Trichonephila clavipes]
MCHQKLAQCIIDNLGPWSRRACSSLESNHQYSPTQIMTRMIKQRFCSHLSQCPPTFSPPRTDQCLIILSRPLRCQLIRRPVPVHGPGVGDYWSKRSTDMLTSSAEALQPMTFCCQVIYSQFGLAIHQNDHKARRRFVEWAQNEIAVVPDFHKRILFSDEAHFWLNGYVNKQNCRIWSEANPQVYVETPLHPEKLTVWCALWAGGILLQKR